MRLARPKDRKWHNHPDADGIASVHFLSRGLSGKPVSILPSA
jgi:hypothetical protein